MPRLAPDQWMAQLDLPEIYRVGGSVRDELLGRHSKDSDYMVRMATLSEIRTALASAGAKPSELRLRGGPQIGWRAAVKGIGLLELVLPRTEQAVAQSPEDFFANRSRREFDIHCDPAIELPQDAVRRDFTINALYRNVRTGEVLDPLGRGLKDLEDRSIHTTHPNSFHDDPLRTLRALRFVSKLPGFMLHAQTYNQMKIHSPAVNGLTQKGVSGTALVELEGILMGSNPGYALRLARDTCVLRILLPELQPMLGYEQRSRYHDKDTDEHTFDALQAAAHMHGHAPLRVRMALLFHDSGKPTMAWVDGDGLQHYYALDPQRIAYFNAPATAMKSHEWWGARHAEDALKRLNAPKKLRQDVVTLIERHMLPLHENTRPFKVRKWRAELGDDMLRDLITHRLADVLGKGGDVSEAVEVLQWIAAEQQRAVHSHVPTLAKDMAISGQDLLDLGLRGPEIGALQKELLQEVLAQPKLNDHAWLTKAAQLRANRVIRARSLVSAAD